MGFFQVPYDSVATPVLRGLLIQLLTRLKCVPFTVPSVPSFLSRGIKWAGWVEVEDIKLAKNWAESFPAQFDPLSLKILMNI